ncbi:hypothetical protein BDA96_07G084300 [Sorghum bicolor]|uniref:Uncharacterized protein n=2 Tax=Sorghum bicolor TaxID=4558 RepID=A0A921QJF3_SORBI|nr:hypothetical protein BDA96_07G084300 [Sorghum bicolor]OQU80111.1 hypothetical protein SORBI_3007G080660 [Sorghum bicolor]
MGRARNRYDDGDKPFPLLCVRGSAEHVVENCSLRGTMITIYSIHHIEKWYEIGYSLDEEEQYHIDTRMTQKIA